jgi:hypothetical protein
MALGTLAFTLVILLIFLMSGTSHAYAAAPLDATAPTSQTTAQGPQFNPGDSVTLTVTCSNTGQKALSDVVVRTEDPWIEAGQRERSLGSIQVGGQKSAEFTALVPKDASLGTTHSIAFVCSAPGVTLSRFSVDINVAAQPPSTSSFGVPTETIMIGGGIIGVAAVAAILDWIRRHPRPTAPPIFADPAPNVPGRILADPAPNVPGRILADPAPNVPGRVFADPAPNVPGRILADPAPNVPGRVIMPGDGVWVQPGGQVWNPPPANQVIPPETLNVNQNANMNVNQNPVNVNTQTPVNVNVNVPPPPLPQPTPTPVIQSPQPGQASGFGTVGTVAATAAGVAAATGIAAVALSRRTSDRCVWCASNVKRDELVCTRCGVHQECPRCGTPLYRANVVSRGYNANPQDQGLFCDRCNTFTS